ncbi:protein FRG1 [Cryptococcus neoformans C23]|uniref:Protein FRG1 n=1 Tax=Cryptococcus neoformans (strain H99 / ATCC 208821 / CBS 10515 / FGSC 9487) TaxID=235443 RepID=J9VNR8_CRYN9|nr:protein FRG1 [Cryptococcus neoformans var. grubii H99]AUB23887.1 protein FRG1 [Cryptococcus neoformans var. grubii]OWZ33372.1 protein FRG1 [Cryptococcus neoformans var. grubii AD2-60a]OWZ45468.1 protein FRG1 [Cryptococcus neoformans var. grubii C23]OWZ47761.1 protein FRG1 [Cryptococcus neoformans var. grubii AD1-83a]OWZ52851.1 protein FRG1 [Cryptococcus neoformans var. grubii 125.91]OXC85529.1 protein FRG1 [Cryptococcus neoformans var. grubii AD1-7a]OXG36170.1 protein FRG1 [Cryptococcus n|eukprot:XP_012048642.1 protein FRG1 [Cryptococcus neoformans var. grubii H99]
MSAAGVVSKKLKFKGEKSKKKKRSHHHSSGRGGGGGDGDELEALAAADPRGWMFPSNPMEINGPAYILLPTEPLTCLAWDATRQKVYAAPVDIPQAPEGANDLSESEILLTIEPTDVNHVWVISRLSGSEDVVSLRTSTGTFLTASPSGSLTATTPSRGPLEAFIPINSRPSTPSVFPTFALQIQHNSKYFSATTIAGKAELRADADDVGEFEGLRIKCQREFVYKARQGEDVKGKKRMADSGPSAASIEDDEMRRNREAQTWGAGRIKLSDKDRRDVKKAKKEGRYAEAMLDRRAALKSDRYAK